MSPRAGYYIWHFILKSTCKNTENGMNFTCKNDNMKMSTLEDVFRDLY